MRPTRTRTSDVSGPWLGGGKSALSNALCGRAHYRDAKAISPAEKFVFFNEYAAVNPRNLKGALIWLAVLEKQILNKYFL
jgi:hypothetical protein